MKGGIACENTSGVRVSEELANQLFSPLKLSCVRCVSDTQVASTLVWSVTVEGNDRSEKDYVTPFGSRDQFVTMVALYHWLLGQ